MSNEITNRKPVKGDWIMLDRGFYYHHGIYENDETVYQFASPEGAEISPDTAKVLTTSLEKFLKGGKLEFKKLSDEDLKNKKSPDEIIEYAKNHLGEMGYNLLTNNCEHFASRCYTGISKSDQADNPEETINRFLSSLFGGLK